jgi:hypothetical protein
MIDDCVAGKWKRSKGSTGERLRVELVKRRVRKVRGEERGLVAPGGLVWFRLYRELYREGSWLHVTSGRR